MGRQRFRSIFDLERDGTLPQGPKGYGGDKRFSARGRRLLAIQGVLYSLPQAQYDGWRKLAPQIAWFIPDQRLWGQLDRFPNVPIIYLSPYLELVSDAAVVGLVAHEMAHALLDHLGGEFSYDEMEAQAHSAVREWGFAEEAEVSERELFAFFKSVKPDEG